MNAVKLIIDSMFGNVARELRLLGYDALLVRDEDDSQILSMAMAQSRTLVTRDMELARRAGYAESMTKAIIPTLFLDEKNPKLQTAHVLASLNLSPEKDGVQILSRCLECGTMLVDVPFQDIADRVPPYVAAMQKRFRTCRDCERVYWHGTHADKLLQRAEEIVKTARRLGLS